MKGIEKITVRIESDSKAEIAQILQEAEAKAKQIRDDYQERSAKATAAAEEAAKQAAKSRLERLESSAHMEARTMLLATKQACLDDVFQKTQEALNNLPEEEYADLLAALAQKASRTGKEEILLSARDKKRVGKKLTEKTNLKLSRETRQMEGGLTLRDGNIEINCAFETQLRVLRENMAAEVAEILFA